MTSLEGFGTKLDKTIYLVFKMFTIINNLKNNFNISRTQFLVTNVVLNFITLSDSCHYTSIFLLNKIISLSNEILFIDLFHFEYNL